MGIAIIAILVVVGVAALATGSWPRRLGSQPVCQRCGYDLTGRPRESVRCAECGADLLVPGAMGIGRKRFRPRLLIAGVLALILIYPANLIRNNADHLKPVWWLRMDLRGGSQLQIDALNELQWRLYWGHLTDDQIQVVADRGLEEQANSAIPWVRQWGAFLEAANAGNRLDAVRWRKYLVQESRMTLCTRAIVAQGDRIPICIGMDDSRGNHAFAAYLEWHDIRVDGKAVQTLPATRPGLAPLIVAGNGTLGNQPWIDRQISQSLSAGTHNLKIGLHVRLYPLYRVVSFPEPPSNQRLAQFDVDLSTTFNTALPGAMPAKTFVDPSMRQAVRQAVQIHDVTVYRYPHHPLVEAEVMLHQGVPTRMEFQFFARPSGGTVQDEVSLGPLQCESGGPAYLGGLLMAWDGPRGVLQDVDTVDIICRPDMDYIEKSIEMAPCWGEPVVIPHVKVIHK